MTQPRRPDEIAFYAALRARAAANDGGRYWGGRSAAIEALSQLGMNENRAFYLLQKWTGKGWIDYGMWAWGGWFTDEAPEQLTP